MLTRALSFQDFADETTRLHAELAREYEKCDEPVLPRSIHDKVGELRRLTAAAATMPVRSHMEAISALCLAALELQPPHSDLVNAVIQYLSSLADEPTIARHGVDAIVKALAVCVAATTVCAPLKTAALAISMVASALEV